MQKITLYTGLYCALYTMLPEWNKNTQSTSVQAITLAPKLHHKQRESWLADFITLLMIFADGGFGRLFRWSHPVSKWWKSIVGELKYFTKTYIFHNNLNLQTTSIKQEDTLSEAVSPSPSSASESPFPQNPEMECYFISSDGYKSRWIMMKV